MHFTTAISSEQVVVAEDQSMCGVLVIAQKPALRHPEQRTPPG